MPGCGCGSGTKLRGMVVGRGHGREGSCLGVGVARE